MRRSTWTAQTFEEIHKEADSARVDVDDSYQLLGRDAHVRLRSPELEARPARPAGEDQ